MTVKITNCISIRRSYVFFIVMMQVYGIISSFLSIFLLHCAEICRCFFCFYFSTSLPVIPDVSPWHKARTEGPADGTRYWKKLLLLLFLVRVIELKSVKNDCPPFIRSGAGDVLLMSWTRPHRTIIYACIKLYRCWKSDIEDDETLFF